MIGSCGYDIIFLDYFYIAQIVKLLLDNITLLNKQL